MESYGLLRLVLRVLYELLGVAFRSEISKALFRLLPPVQIFAPWLAPPSSSWLLLPSLGILQSHEHLEEAGGARRGQEEQGGARQSHQARKQARMSHWTGQTAQAG